MRARTWLKASLLALLMMVWPTISRAELLAGAAVVDATPAKLPVIVNGGFLERQVRLISDPIYVRALVFEQEETIAIVVVDSCMMPREFCDRVKATAAEATGIPKNRIMLSATHTHSAPSVMDDCLGTDRDPEYTEFLPAKIVEAITRAQAARRPAEVAWERFDAGEFTNTRRWIFRSGTERTDPFGEKSVRANMHPGYQNPDAIGEAGPEDPWFTLLSVRGTDGRPIGLLANFSMHYFTGHAGVSADYFGHYARAAAKKLAPGDAGFVAMLSQGTSGDLWRADYSRETPKPAVTIGKYAGELADLSAQALAGADYRADVPLAMAEERLVMGRRLPDAARLAWARRMVGEMDGARPRNQPEVYAEQAIYLHENPEVEVVLQAIRIGELGISSMPNEVYGLSGLKLKHLSPLDVTMNIELANGAAGYIPPPEQFPLGGYNTWPARTAGLATDAEPRIVEASLRLLEKVSGRPRRKYREPANDYAVEVLRSRPKAFWRLGDLDGSGPLDDATGQLRARFESGVVFHLEGRGDGRCAHFAGGRVAAQMPEETSDYSVSFWFWNGIAGDQRPVSAYLFSRGKGGDPQASGEHLGIGGTHSHSGRLFVYNGNERQGLLGGDTPLGLKKWHHVALVRKGAEIVVHLDGREEIRGQLEPTHEGASDMFFGGRSDNFANLEGRLDELAFYDRALEGGEIRRLYAASAPMESPPSSPQQTLEQSHVRDGYTVELVAAEPLVVDPVAIDWGEDGSVWVAEMADYPYGLHGGGRVARLLDTDGDGQLDKREDFLAGLSFPAGVMAWGKGVIIAAAPDILYAEDRDGDGVADFTEKWFSGFMEGNQQLRVNGLRLGLDGWIYCASGGHHAGFGTQTVVTAHRTGEKVSLGSRDFRFRPDGRIEPESGPSQFGRVRDDFGNWFGVQNAHPLWHYVLPDRYLRRNPDAPAPDPRNQLRDHMPRLFPAKATQKRFHGFDHVGRYTSACGISIYRDELLFPRVSGRTIAFTCAPFHNVVQRHVLLPDGVGFAAERADDGEIDFFASRDRWCRPVMSRTAPDGSLWIVDMYRYMIEHPDWLPPEGKDELRPHYRAGEDRGRIYRVYPTGKRPEPFRGLREGMLAGRNGIVTDLVLRSAGEWGFSERTAAGRAAELAAGAKPIAGLSDPDPGVRSLAIRMLEGEEPPPGEVFRLVDDPAGQVRLQLAFSLGEWGTPEATQCLIELALAGGGDPFLRAAIMSSAIPHFQPLLEGLLENDAADPELLSGLIAMASDEIAIPLLSDVSDPSNAQLRNAARWLLRHPEEQERFQALLASASEIYADEASPIERRAAALPLLITRDQRVAEGVFVNPELARVAIIAGCERGLGAELVARWRRFSPEMRSLIINQCLNSLPNVQALTAELGKSIQPQEFTAAQRQRLLEFKDTKIQARAKQVFGERVSDRASLVESYQPSLRIDGDPEKGRHHFRAACAVCHRLENHGGEVGPDLTAITNRTKPALLTAILDPNRNVDPRHLGYAALGSETTLAAGMISAETATSVIFRLLDGSTKPVARKDIVTLENLGRSFMPEGLEANLDQQAMADLLAYLDRQLSTEASTSD